MSRKKPKTLADHLLQGDPHAHEARVALVILEYVTRSLLEIACFVGELYLKALKWVMELGGRL